MTLQSSTKYALQFITLASGSRKNEPTLISSFPIRDFNKMRVNCHSKTVIHLIDLIIYLDKMLNEKRQASLFSSLLNQEESQTPSLCNIVRPNSKNVIYSVKTGANAFTVETVLNSIRCHKGQAASQMRNVEK